MKIDIDNGLDQKNRVNSYSNKEIIVNNVAYTNSFILTKDKIIANWQHNALSELSLDDFSLILDLKPEIILLGTGKRLYFPQADIIANIQGLNIGFEVMDTMAACRSYNILLAEGRQVAAMLILDDHSGL